MRKIQNSYKFTTVYQIDMKFNRQLYLLFSTKRTKIVVTRHDFWAQNVPKMLLRPGLRPKPRFGSSQRSPDPLWGPNCGREGREMRRERNGRERRSRERKEK